MPIMAFPFPFGDTLIGHAKYRGGGSTFCVGVKLNALRYDESKITQP